MATRPTRLQHPKRTTIKPKDSHYERGTTGEQVITFASGGYPQLPPGQCRGGAHLSPPEHPHRLYPHHRRGAGLQHRISVHRPARVDPRGGQGGGAVKRVHLRALRHGPLLLRTIRKQILILQKIKPAFLDRALVDIADLDPAIAIADDHHITDIDEQPVFHHPRDLIQNQ